MSLHIQKLYIHTTFHSCNRNLYWKIYSINR